MGGYVRFGDFDDSGVGESDNDDMGCSVMKKLSVGTSEASFVAGEEGDSLDATAVGDIVVVMIGPLLGKYPTVDGVGTTICVIWR